MYAEAVIAEFDGVRPAAREYMEANINAGHITLARQGEDSRMLRRAWKIPKYPSRPRLIISCPPELSARFHAQRGDTPPAVHLADLMDLKDGIGELP
jgi:hypothetical protein